MILPSISAQAVLRKAFIALGIPIMQSAEKK